MSNTIDNAILRNAYDRGAEARWREGFPEHMSLTDMERAAHTAGLREVLRLLPPPPMPSEAEIEKLANEVPGGVIWFARALLERFGARDPEPIAFADRKPETCEEVYLAWPWHKDPTVWVWRLGGPGISATHWLPIDTPCLPTRRVVT